MAKNAFITWGGWDGHEPEQTTAIFADVLRSEGYQVEGAKRAATLNIGGSATTCVSFVVEAN